MDSGTALQALNSFQPTSSADLLSQAQSKYGVQDLSARVAALRGLTSNLTNSIAAVDPSVTGRTSGSLVTEAQRSALVNRERQPLLTDLGNQNQALSSATGDLNTNQSLATQLASGLANDQTNKYNQLKSQYEIANSREQAAAQARAEAAKQAESSRQFDAAQANENARSANSIAASRAASAPNPAAGYSVKQLTSGNKAYTGPSGQTNLYQYAAAVSGGNPNATYNQILSQLKTGSSTDKKAYNKVASMSMAQGISYLQKNNSYIFD